MTVYISTKEESVSIRTRYFAKLKPNGSIELAETSDRGPEDTADSDFWADYYAKDGYVYLAGFDQVGIIDFDRNSMLPGVVQALREKAQKLRADGEQAAREVETEISKFLSLTHEPAREVDDDCPF